MAHPFFDSLLYPWARPEAVRLHAMLMAVYRDPVRIDQVYQQCKVGLPPLALAAAPDIIWKQALENLASYNGLRKLCDLVGADPGLARNSLVQAALRDVVNAQPARDTVIISDDVIVLDRAALRHQIELLESDTHPVKVVLVRGGPRSGKSHGRYLFERSAQDRGATPVYLCDGIVATVDETILQLFSALEASNQIPARNTTDDAWYKAVCFKLQELAAAKKQPLWIAVDDLGPAPDGGPLLDQEIRRFFEQFALNMLNPAFRRWFRLLLIHYPDGPVPTKWRREFWAEDRTSAGDITADHVAGLLREWTAAHERTLIEDELLDLAKNVIDKADADLAQGAADASRPQLIHDTLVEMLKHL